MSALMEVQESSYDAKESVERCLRHVVESDMCCDEKSDVDVIDEVIQQLISSDPLLEKIYIKSQKRSLTDRKVAPGSDSVTRSVLNARYCLCLLYIKKGKRYELQSSTYEQAKSCYQKALIWYPKSIEAGHLLGLLLRSQACKSEDLDFVVYLWERAMDSARILEQSVCEKKTASSFPLTSAEQSVLDILLSSECSAYSDSLDSSVIQSCISKSQENIVYKEREAAKALYDSAILLYCQEGMMMKALPLLLQQHYQWKLSQQVLSYMSEDSDDMVMKRRVAQLRAREDYPFVLGYDSVLPEEYLRRLQHIFRPSSPFWSEHDYDFYNNCSRQVGYFSYIYDFRRRPATNFIEQVIDIVFKKLTYELEGEAAFSENGVSELSCLQALRNEATTAEWWVHSRPHSSGHQFHFDSDETALYGGEHAQHPIASCIIYLSECVGGPTVVTNQTLSSANLASYGFLVHPKENRLLAFDATFLHGVIPGKGVCPEDTDNVKFDSNLCPRRRLSFMVGFWRSIKAKNRGPGCPGPGQPFPDMPSNSKERSQRNCSTINSHNYTWPDEMMDMLPKHKDNKTAAESVCSHKVYPNLIEPIWEAVSTEKFDRHCEIRATYSRCFQGF